MPIISGAIASFFAFIAGILAKRLTIGLAAAAAFVATSSAAFLAVKVSIAALVAGLTIVVPPAIASVVGYFMPGNLAPCITAVLLADTIVKVYEYWRGTMGTAVQLAKG